MEVTGLRPATLSSEFRQRPQLRVHRFVIGCFVSAGALRKNSWPLYFRVVTHTLVPQCEHRQPPTFIVSPIQTGIHNPAVTKESRRWRTWFVPLRSAITVSLQCRHGFCVLSIAMCFHLEILQLRIRLYSLWMEETWRKTTGSRVISIFTLTLANNRIAPNKKGPVPNPITIKITGGADQREWSWKNQKP